MTQNLPLLVANLLISVFSTISEQSVQQTSALDVSSKIVTVVVTLILVAIAVAGVRGSQIRRKQIGLRSSLVSIGILIAFFGIILTGDFITPWVGYYNKELGYTLVDVGLSGFVVFIFIDTLLFRNKRRVWKDIHVQMKALVETELNGITTDVMMITGVRAVAIEKMGESVSDTTDLYRKSALADMENLASDMKKLRARVPKELFDGAYGEIFAQRAKRLQQLQLSYWSEFLDPRQVALMINLEQLLDSLDTQLAIVVKQRQAKDALSKGFAELYEDAVYEDLQRLLATLARGCHEGLITLMP